MTSALPGSALTIRTASVDITPDYGTPWAFSIERPPAPLERHHGERYHAKASLLVRGDDSMLVVSLDALWVTAELRQHVVEVAASYGLHPAATFLAASHTHSSPQVLRDPGKGRLGASAYLDLLRSRLESLIADIAASEAIEVTPTYGEGNHPESVIRLLPRVVLTRSGRIERRLTFNPNRRAPVDTRVRVLSFSDNHGTVRAVWFGYGTHPTILNGPELSRDYPGFAQDFLEGSLGCPVQFFLGFAGDARPPLTESWLQTLRRPRQIARLLLYRVRSFRYGSHDEARAFGHRVGRCALDVVLRRSHPLDPSLESDEIQVDLPLAHGGTTPLVIQRLSIGHVAIVGLGGEVFQSFLKPIQRRFPHLVIWPVGLANDVTGYLHPRAIVDMDPYGVGTVLRGDIGALAPDHERAILEGFDTLAARCSVSAETRPDMIPGN